MAQVIPFSRVQTEHGRFYICPQSEKHASVTTIVSGVQSQQSKQKLAEWNKLNPGVSDKAAERGTWIHKASENFLVGKQVSPPEKYEKFWQGMDTWLTYIRDECEVLWSERPVGQYEKLWSHAVPEDGIARVYYRDPSRGVRYAGAPDLIYRTPRGQIILADFKTSNGPYLDQWPAKGDPDYKGVNIYSSRLKFNKCAVQLVAYKYAVMQTLGITPNRLQIVVATDDTDKPWSTQRFLLTEQEENYALWQWKNCLRCYFHGGEPVNFLARMPKKKLLE